MTIKAKVTDRYASSLEWHGKSYIVRDEVTPGFAVRVWGAKPSQRAYIVQTKRDGKQHNEALGIVGEIKAEEARQKAITFKGVLRAGHDPKATAAQRRAAWTLSDAMTYFLGTHAKAKGLSEAHVLDSQALYKNHVPTKWKSLRVTDITKPMVVKRFVEITDGYEIAGTRVRGGERRANAYLTLMSKLFNLAIENGHATVNAATGIDKNKLQGRERFLSEVEAANLWRYCAKHDNVEAAVAVQFILLTGCRPKEAFTAEWKDIDLGRATWTKPKTKQGKVHNVALNALAVQVLGRLETAKRSKFVFPSPTDNSKSRTDKVKSFWRGVRKHCALPDVRLYDCRHSFASWLANQGASLYAIGQQLGHSNPVTTMRYAHLTDVALRQNAEKVAATLERALALPVTLGKDDPAELDKRPLVAELHNDGTVTETSTWEIGDAAGSRITIPGRN